MKKLYFLLTALLASLSLGAQTTVTFDFDNDATTLFGIEGRSSGSGDTYVADGDITEPTTATLDGVSLTVSAAAEGVTNPNRLWYSKPTLRMYSGTLTFSAPGHKITTIKFTAPTWDKSSKGNAFSSGTYESKVWTATEDVETVVLTIASNTQFNSIAVTLDEEGVEPPAPVEIAGTGEGTLESPYDVTRANSLIENEKQSSSEVYIKGTISAISEISTSYGNATYTITDGTATLIVFRGYGLGGAKFTSEDDLAINDEVVVYGKLVNYNGTYEVNSGSILYSLNGEVYTPEPVEPYTPTGAGTKENPYTAADVTGLNTLEGETYAWVKGYILGCATSATKLAEGNAISDTNIALGDAADATEFVPVALPIGTEGLRDAVGVKTNPANVGREILVYGQLTKYFTVAGVKEVSEWEFVGDAPIVNPGESEAIYEIDFTTTTQEEAEADDWDFGTLEYTSYGAADNLTFTAEGIVMDGSAYADTYTVADIYTPYFDLTDYTGVYATWEENCKNFTSDDYVYYDSAVGFMYSPDDTYTSGSYEEVKYEGDRAVNGAEGFTTCRFDIADDYEGMRDQCYFYFYYISAPAEDNYEADYGRWTVKNFKLFGANTQTGIVEAIQPVGEGTQAIYDLSGRRLNRLQKGINIVGGKKVVR